MNWCSTTCWPFDALTPGPERYILHATMIGPDSSRLTLGIDPACQGFTVNGTRQ